MLTSVGSVFDRSSVCPTPAKCPQVAETVYKLLALWSEVYFSKAARWEGQSKVKVGGTGSYLPTGMGPGKVPVKARVGPAGTINAHGTVGAAPVAVWRCVDSGVGPNTPVVSGSDVKE